MFVRTELCNLVLVVSLALLDLHLLKQADHQTAILQLRCERHWPARPQLLKLLYYAQARIQYMEERAPGKHTTAKPKARRTISVGPAESKETVVAIRDIRYASYDDDRDPVAMT